MSSNVKAIGLVISMPLLTEELYGNDSRASSLILTGWRKFAAIITIIACSILEGGIVLGVGLSPAFFAVISSEGVAGLALGCTFLTLALFLLVRYVLNRHQEKKAVPQVVFTAHSSSREIISAPPFEVPLSTIPIKKWEPPKKLIIESPKNLPLISQTVVITPTDPVIPPIPASTVSAPKLPVKTLPPIAAIAAPPLPTLATGTPQSSPKNVLKGAAPLTPTKTNAPSVPQGYYRVGKEEVMDKIKHSFAFLTKVADNELINPLERSDALLLLGKLSLLKYDFNSAFTFFQRAANLDNPDAMYELGLRYFLGEGVDFHIPTAIAWLEKAWEFGCSKAGTKLSIIHAEGLGVKKNPDKAEEYQEERPEDDDYP